MRIQTSLAVSIGVITIHSGISKKQTGGRKTNPDLKDDANDSCGLYMATSSTSMAGVHKWGVYAGKDIEAQSPIGFGDLAIHAFNLMGNQLSEDPTTGEINDDLDANILANIVDWFEQYLWVPQSSGGHFELDNLDLGAKIVTAVPGTGMIGGYNPQMVNADFNHSSAYHREAWNEFPEEAHPGRGAYSNYYNLELASTEVIHAGREIFMEFGGNYDDEGKEKETLSRKDYDRVDQTVQKIIEFFAKYDGKLDSAAKQKIYDFLRQDVMSAAAGADKIEQIKKMLPTDPALLPQLLENGGAIEARAPGSVRSLEWLEENGLCMDNIKPGPSTIPYAGRGAIANRDIQEGGLVAPVPLLHIPDETVLDMHAMAVAEMDNGDSMVIRDTGEKIGIQLLLNYCWGHPQSTQLFFPAGAVVNYINHAPSKDKVNAKLVWSDHAENKLDLLDDSLPNFTDMGSLVVEIVATRDIEEGEEVFIDYGDEWQEKWDKHTELWNQHQEDSWPKRAIDFNQEHKKKPFRTLEDGSEPYPDNVTTKCFLMIKKPSEQIEEDSEGRKIRDWSEADSGLTNIIADNLFSCTIKSHTETSKGHVYDVLWDGGKSTTVVRGVPHKAIVLLDAPEVGDQHIWNSFRHYISMGDIFPEAWKNIGSEDVDESGASDASYDGEEL